MSIGIPVKVVHEAQGHVVTVELKTGDLYRGKLVDAEDNMNCHLSNVVHTARDGKVSQLEAAYVRGSKIRFLIVPDMLTNAPMFRRDKAAARGKGLGLGRGRAAAIRARGGRGGRSSSFVVGCSERLTGMDAHEEASAGAAPQLEAVFKWPHGGKEVFVAGTFNKWEKHRMYRNDQGVWETHIRLPAANHLYKFVVDGNWFYDVEKPTEVDEHGNVNNKYDGEYESCRKTAKIIGNKTFVPKGPKISCSSLRLVLTGQYPWHGDWTATHSAERAASTGDVGSVRTWRGVWRVVAGRKLEFVTHSFEDEGAASGRPVGANALGCVPLDFGTAEWDSSSNALVCSNGVKLIMKQW
eukprot:m51a1_g11714 putative small nuclear ribonucleoprotein sm d3-like (353) ;mRNA; r:75486-77270